MFGQRTAAISGAACSALLLIAQGCISKDSGIIEATQGCEEFVPGEEVPASLDIDADVRAMLEASGDLQATVGTLSTEIRDACIEMATSLGAPDTWSSLAKPSDQVANLNGTGACNAASGRMKAILQRERDRGVQFAFAIERGRCHLDFEAQAACDRKCAVDQPCEPGTVETRCEPGALSVSCNAECSAGASCEGSSDHPANCMGQCESTCQGQCAGVCVAADGTRTENDPNCRGRCSSSCNGACEGICKEEQARSCGVEVTCRGGCTGSFSDPVCESTFQPPDCRLNESCHAGCTAKVAAHPICDSTKVTLFVPADAPDDLKKVAEVINRRAGDILSAGASSGELAADAIHVLATTSSTISDRSGDLSGKSLACAAAASRLAFGTAADVTAMIEASDAIDECISINGFVQIAGP